jgi:excisionase family DNA binding protein
MSEAIQDDDAIQDDHVYVVPEAARLVRISARTYYEAAARGEVPVTRIGRRLVVSGAALRRFLEGGEHTPATRTNAPD